MGPHINLARPCGRNEYGAPHADDAKSIGMVGDVGVRCTSQQPKLFVGMILILIFAEALGLYGLIVALVMSGASCSA